MAHPLNRMRLKRKMRDQLIAGDLEGVPHSELVQKCRTQIFKTSDIRNILDEWKTRGLAESFLLSKPHSKRPIRYWRATSLILSERL
jgi:hypothetical protein